MNAAVTFETAAGRKARSDRKARATRVAHANKTEHEKEITRVQFDVSSGSMQRLKDLKRKIEATSYAEVVKNALRLYEALIVETENGSRFVIEDAEGKSRPFRMFVS